MKFPPGILKVKINDEESLEKSIARYQNGEYETIGYGENHLPEFEIIDPEPLREMKKAI